VHKLLRATAALPLLVAGLLVPAGRLGAQVASAASATVPPAPAEQGEPPLLLEPHLWRNFQPTTGTPDSALTLLIRVTAAERQALPRGLWVERAIAREGGRSWTVRFRPDDVEIEEGALELVARGGPPWRVGAPVDVTVVLRDARGRSWRLAVRAAPIRRLD
jgi:hypothetical protein